MTVNVQTTLKLALQQLEGERSQLDKQIEAIRLVLQMSGGGQPRVEASAPKRKMSPSARKLISQRMKLRWAERRAAIAAQAKTKKLMSERMKEAWAKRKAAVAAKAKAGKKAKASAKPKAQAKPTPQQEVTTAAAK